MFHFSLTSIAKYTECHCKNGLQEMQVLKKRWANNLVRILWITRSTCYITTGIYIETKKGYGETKKTLNFGQETKSYDQGLWSGLDSTIKHGRSLRDHIRLSSTAETVKPSTVRTSFSNKEQTPLRKLWWWRRQRKWRLLETDWKRCAGSWNRWRRTLCLCDSLVHKSNL